VMKLRVILNTVLLALALGTPASQFAQNASTGAGKPSPQSHERAMGFLRTINTAESEEFSKYGSYASWPTLLAHQAKYLDTWLGHFYSHVPNVHFGQLPEALPGLNLRLSVHADGHGYDVLVEDVSDKDGFAGLSDERAVIRECRWLN
jgi:hypothetical protein